MVATFKLNQEVVEYSLVDLSFLYVSWYDAMQDSYFHKFYQNSRHFWCQLKEMNT